MCLCCSKGGLADGAEGWGGENCLKRPEWRSATIGMLLLRFKVVRGAGCCSLLCSETIKWTVISPECVL